MGIDANMVLRISDLLTETVAVIGNTKDAVSIEIKKGVRQGCPLSPILFITVLACMVKEVKLHIIPEFHFEFADDLTLIDSSREKLENIVSLIKEKGPKYGLVINENKTEFIKVANNKFEKEALLLGSWIGSSQLSVSMRIEKARKSFYALYNSVWKAKEISVKAKVEIFKVMCISTLLYGLESVTVLKADEVKLDSFSYQCMVRILGLFYKDYGHVSRINVADKLTELGILYELPSMLLRKKRIVDQGHFKRNHREDPRDIFHYRVTFPLKFRKMNTMARTIESDLKLLPNLRDRYENG